jgi:hypothetical protein
MARNRWVLAVLLTLGLLGWELGLLWFLSGELGTRAGVLGARLAWDAALLLPVWVAALFLARPRDDQARTTVEAAALLSLSFLLLLMPVAAGRNLLQRQLARPPAPEASAGQPVSATDPEAGNEGRFLCAAVGSDLSAAQVEPDGGSLAETAWAGARDALLLQVPVFPLTLLLLRRRPRTASPGARTALSPLALLVVLGIIWGRESDGRSSPPGVTPLQEGESGCPTGAPVRTYAVAAIPVDIPLNEHGDHVPQGLMYALEEDLPAIQERKSEAIQPLVLRANVGECLVLHFTNRLSTGPAALRIEGLRATVRGAGQEGGFVPSASVEPGQRLTYVLPLPETPTAEGAYLLHDSEDGGEREVRGLFGALLLEPAGAVYRSATTGEPLKHGGGWEALIDVPTGQDFREVALLYHAMGPPEVADVRSASGALLPVQDEMAGPFRPGAFGLNYRSQPNFEREDTLSEDDTRDRATPSGARVAPPLLRSYLGEPVKLRVVHAGSAEFHIHHLHGGNERRGYRAGQAPASPFEQPQLLSQGSGLTLTTEGPGSVPASAGNFLVHCHVPNHSAGGERLTWRVYATRQPSLAPLPGQSPPDP